MCVYVRVYLRNARGLHARWCSGAAAILLARRGCSVTTALYSAKRALVRLLYSSPVLLLHILLEKPCILPKEPYILQDEPYLLLAQGSCSTVSGVNSNYSSLQHTATHCKTLQHTARHCKYCRTLQDTATHYSILHCTAMQHTATHKTLCSTL